MKKHRWAVAFTACLLAFTTYISLDTFVLSNAYQTNATEINLSSIKPGAEAEAVPEAETGTETDEAKQVPKTDEAVSEADPEGNTTAGSESSHHKKKPGSGSGGPGSGSDGSGSRSGGPGSGSGRHGSVHGGPGGGKGMGGSSASTTTIRNFDEEEAEASAAEVTTDNSGSSQDYQDDNIKITYTQYTTNDTTIHVADVQLSSAEYLKTAFANDTYGKNVTQTTSDIAAANKAILAINGDYYGVQEKGYVIRNGVLYREEAGTNDVLCIYGDGSMKIVDPSTVTAQELLDQGVWQAFSFGPGLVADGQIPISLDTEVGRAKASNPRTAIGQRSDGAILMLVINGRQPNSLGATYADEAELMLRFGAINACTLDGGTSSLMWFDGGYLGNSATVVGIRPIPTCFLVMPEGGDSHES